MIILLLVFGLLFLMLFAWGVGRHTVNQEKLIKQADRIVDHLGLIKRSLDWGNGEVIGPQLSEIRTELHKVATGYYE